MNDIVIDGLIFFSHNGEYGKYIRAFLKAFIKKKYIYKENTNIDISLLKYKFLDISNKDKIYLNIIENLSNDTKIFHCMNNGFRFNNNSKYKIMNVSSMLPIISKSTINEAYLDNFNDNFYSSIKKANVIFTTSNYQKKILSKYIKDSSHIKVIYPFIEDKFEYNKLSYSIVKSKVIGYPKINYLLFSGDLHKVKNLESILKFFSQLKLQTGINDKLVIATYAIHKDYEENLYLYSLKEKAKELNIYNDTIFLYDISESDEYHLIRLAKKFIDLSFDCDFNYSILKAFICDTDIICSDLPLYKEYLDNYPNYYTGDIDLIPIIYLQDKSDYEKEKFDYLKDRYKCEDSINTLKQTYIDILKRGK